MAIAANASAAATAEALVQDLAGAKQALDASRPTAVNLMWATERIYQLARSLIDRLGDKLTVQQIKARILLEAKELADDDVRINRRLGFHGAAVVPEKANILHHCNTGSLATVGFGTALGIIYAAHEQGKKVHVWVDETRPRLQGAKLTCWELMRAGVDLDLIADSASGFLMQQGKVDVVVFGADRVAANGDVANKIGTYNLAIVAREHGVPVYAAVPTRSVPVCVRQCSAINHDRVVLSRSTIDLNLKDGSGIPIEERSASEVTEIGICVHCLRSLLNLVIHPLNHDSQAQVALRLRTSKCTTQHLT